MNLSSFACGNSGKEDVAQGCEDAGFFLEAVISLQWLSWLWRVAPVLAQHAADMLKFLADS